MRGIAMLLSLIGSKLERKDRKQEGHRLLDNEYPSSNSYTGELRHPSRTSSHGLKLKLIEDSSAEEALLTVHMSWEIRN